MQSHNISKKKDKEKIATQIIKVNFLNIGRIFFLIKIFFNFLPFSRAAMAACGGSQARDLIGAIAAGLCHSHSHSNAGSKPRLRPASQLTAMPDP